MRTYTAFASNAIVVSTLRAPVIYTMICHAQKLIESGSQISCPFSPFIFTLMY